MKVCGGDDVSPCAHREEDRAGDVVPEVGVEPTRPSQRPPDFESGASAKFRHSGPVVSRGEAILADPHKSRQERRTRRFRFTPIRRCGPVALSLQRDGFAMFSEDAAEAITDFAEGRIGLHSADDEGHQVLR